MNAVKKSRNPFEPVRIDQQIAINMLRAIGWWLDLEMFLVN